MPGALKPNELDVSRQGPSWRTQSYSGSEKNDPLRSQAASRYFEGTENKKVTPPESDNISINTLSGMKKLQTSYGNGIPYRLQLNPMMGLADTSVNYLRYYKEHALNASVKPLDRIFKGQESYGPDQVGYNPLLSQIVSQNRNKSNTTNASIEDKMLFGPHLRETFAQHVHKRYIEETESDAEPISPKHNPDSH